MHSAPSAEIDVATESSPVRREKRSNLIGLLAPYWVWVAGLVVMTVVSNALNLAVPQFISRAIDGFTRPGFSAVPLVFEFVAVSIGIFAFTYAQSVIQTLT